MLRLSNILSIILDSFPFLQIVNILWVCFWSWPRIQTMLKVNCLFLSFVGRCSLDGNVFLHVVFELHRQSLCLDGRERCFPRTLGRKKQSWTIVKRNNSSQTGYIWSTRLQIQLSDMISFPSCRVMLTGTENGGWYFARAFEYKSNTLPLEHCQSQS